MAKRKKEQALKKVAYRFIPPDNEVGQHMYALLRQLVQAHHKDIADARIALAWNLTWKADVDGRVKLGMCKLVSDLEREVNELLSYDFVIILQKKFWHDQYVNDLQRMALIDHELCHATVKLGDKGEPVVDECGRKVYRIRRHDLEEFACIAERYGMWKQDIEQFERALRRAKHRAHTGWVGFSNLQLQLRAAGAAVPLEMIVAWTDERRREAAAWAMLKQELPRSAPPMPQFMADIAVKEPVQDTLPPIPPAGFPEPTDAIAPAAAESPASSTDVAPAPPPALDEQHTTDSSTNA